LFGHEEGEVTQGRQKLLKEKEWMDGLKWAKFK
jgi:hypothetical protein